MEKEKQPEKATIKIDFAGSGVKTLNGVGQFFFILAIAAGVAAVVATVIYAAEVGSASTRMVAVALIWPSISTFFTGLGIGAVCKGLSTIARAAHYKIKMIERETIFIDDSPTSFWKS